MSITLCNTIEIDESDYKSIKNIDEHDRVMINNKLDVALDEKSFFNHLERLKGTDRVVSLGIGWTSHLKNVEIVKLFPNLRILQIWGRNIISLEGLEWFRKGEHITIETKKNRKRNIEKITQTSIENISLSYGRKDDFDVIGKCPFIRKLVIFKSPSPNFYDWKNVPIDYLKFSDGILTELRDISQVKTLKDLFIGACGNFVEFTGDNSSVRQLIVYGCRCFDIRSIT